MKKGFFYLNLFIGVLFVLLGIYGNSLLYQRPDIPRDIDKKNVIQLDDINIIKTQDIEFVIHQKSIGDPIRIRVESDGLTKSIETNLVPYYSKSLFPLFYLLIGLFLMATGFFVFILRPYDRKARVYYWASMTCAYSLIINQAFYLAFEGWASYIPGFLFFITFSFAAALLLHFSFQFTPRHWRVPRWVNFTIIYVPASIFALLMTTLFLLCIVSESMETYHTYLAALSVFRIYIILMVSVSLGHLIRLYNLIFIQEQRAQIKWALFGMTVSLAPFILLYQIPLALHLNPIFSEELSNVFFIIIPVTFTIAIFKYKLMNIELVINRSLVYGFLTIFTVCMYLFTVHLFQTYVARLFNIKDIFMSGLAALVAACTFHPARKKIQGFVDKTFYRLSYDYKKSILCFIEQTQKIVNPDALLNLFFENIADVLPIEKLGIIVLSKKTKPPTFLYQRGLTEKMDRLLETPMELSRFSSRRTSVRTEEGVDFSREEILEDLEREAFIPLNCQSTHLCGTLILGKKKSGERYSREDIELLLTLSREFSVNLERIRLQEEVFIEKAEKEKLDELNRMKTDFISSVSHEIRTPMGSIQGLSEILQEGKVRDSTKQKELLDLIGKECARLSRFLHNILDFSKIETQTKQYELKPTEIRPIIEDCLKLLERRLESEGFLLITFFPEDPVILNIDRDAFLQVLTNLLDNAIKYSSKRKEIEVSVKKGETEVAVQVEDKGIGIPPNEQKKIFNAFFRSPEAERQFPKGVGLGLKIVKHIMDAHHGRIDVKSRKGQGSLFRLVFPLP